MTDDVNRPSHYNSHPSGVECIEVSEELTPNLAQSYQYVFRAGLKPKVEEKRDLRAARWFLRREMRRLSNWPSVKAMRAVMRDDPPVLALAKKVCEAEPDFDKADALRMIVYSVDDIMHYYKPLAIEAIRRMLARHDTPDQAAARVAIRLFCQERRIRPHQKAQGMEYAPESAQPPLIVPDDDPCADLAALEAWHKPHYLISRDGQKKDA